MENNLLVHKWKLSDMIFFLYKERELRKIHR